MCVTCEASTVSSVDSMCKKHRATCCIHLMLVHWRVSLSVIKFPFHMTCFM